jgi:16S rRNA (uracil1498-N3)-methyltransferase
VSGAVTSVDRETVVIAVGSRAVDPPSSPRLVVVQALAKGDRGERAVEALAEVGVDEIVPWSAARSVALWSGDRGERAVERWRTIGREASKQARRSWFPVVADLADTETVERRVAASPLAVVCHESAEARLSAVDPAGADEVLLVVGPEGGLTDDEVTAFVAAGAVACRLGDTVLRTSTAGVVAASVVLARTRWTT